MKIKNPGPKRSKTVYNTGMGQKAMDNKDYLAITAYSLQGVWTEKKCPDCRSNLGELLNSSPTKDYYCPKCKMIWSKIPAVVKAVVEG